MHMARTLIKKRIKKTQVVLVTYKIELTMWQDYLSISATQI